MTTNELEPVDYYCRHCDSAMEETECESPYCTGYRCLNCGAGCDFYEQAEGFCATAVLRSAIDENIDRYARVTIRNRRPIRTIHLPEGDCS